MLAARALSLKAVPSLLVSKLASVRCSSISPRARPVFMSSADVRSHKRSMVRIGTHSGTFHCDEALGCFLLKQTPEFKDADIVRSRDPKVLQDLDVVIDVGGTYDEGEKPNVRSLLVCLAMHDSHCSNAPPFSEVYYYLHAASKRFDHHQRGFEEIFGHGESPPPPAAACTMRPGSLPVHLTVAVQNRQHGTSLHCCSMPYRPENSAFMLQQEAMPVNLRAGFGTKLSSAGLVYKHFGRSIIAAQLGQPEDAPDTETVYLAVYKNFMEAIDGIDNGERLTLL